MGSPTATLFIGDLWSLLVSLLIIALVLVVFILRCSRVEVLPWVNGSGGSTAPVSYSPSHIDAFYEPPDPHPPTVSSTR